MTIPPPTPEPIRTTSARNIAWILLGVAGCLWILGAVLTVHYAPYGPSRQADVRELGAYGLGALVYLASIPAAILAVGKRQRHVSSWGPLAATLFAPVLWIVVILPLIFAIG